MCAVNLETQNVSDGLGKIAGEVINDVKSDLKEGITNIEREALSFFGKVKAKITKNLSALKALFISGSMVVAVVAAIKGLAAVGLAALGPAGWAVIGGAFLVGLAISAYSAHAKGAKGFGGIVKSMLADLCTYTALCVLSVINKMISEGKTLTGALVSLKDDLLGNAEKDLNKIKTDIQNCFTDTNNKIEEILRNTLERVVQKRKLLEGAVTTLKEKLQEQEKKGKKEDTKNLQALKTALEAFENDKLKNFQGFIEKLGNETKTIQSTFGDFLKSITKEQKANGTIIPTDPKKLVEDFQNKISEVHKSLGKIVLEANTFLKSAIPSPQDIEKMIQNGTVKLLEYGSNEIAQKCYELDKAFSGKNEVNGILKHVSENVKNKNFENLEQTFSRLTNLTGSADIKRQIGELKKMYNDEVNNHKNALTPEIMKDKIQNFFNKLFGINQEPPKVINNLENNIINNNVEQPV